MDYIKQLREFDYLCLTALPGITSNYRSVYFALLSINNQKYWAEEFEVDFEHVLALSRTDKDTYRRAMNYFKENGLFNCYHKGINKWARATVSLKVLSDNAVAKPLAIARTATDNPTATPLPNAPIATDKPIAIPLSTAHYSKTINNKTEKTDTTVAAAFDDVFNFFKNTRNRQSLLEAQQITAETIDAYFKRFYDEKIDLGELDKKTPADIIKHFSMWLPKVIQAAKSRPGSSFAPTVFPAAYSKKYMESLATPDLQKRYRQHLNAAGIYFLGYNPKGDSVWGEKPG